MITVCLLYEIFALLPPKPKIKKGLGPWGPGNYKSLDTFQQCTMYLTLHSFSLKLCSATLDLKT